MEGKPFDVGLELSLEELQVQPISFVCCWVQKILWNESVNKSWEVKLNAKVKPLPAKGSLLKSRGHLQICGEIKSEKKICKKKCCFKKMRRTSQRWTSQAARYGYVSQQMRQTRGFAEAFEMSLIKKCESTRHCLRQRILWNSSSGWFACWKGG